MRRFAANKSKARQATSRAKQIEKIKVDDIKPSSRAYPFVRFEAEKNCTAWRWKSKASRRNTTASCSRISASWWKRANASPSSAPTALKKTTLLRCIGAELTGLQADTGRVKWAENANVGYMPQDPTEDFATDAVLTDWIGQWTKEGDDDQAVRSILGRLLFGGDDVKKSVRVLSGGEKAA